MCYWIYRNSLLQRNLKSVLVTHCLLQSTSCCHWHSVQVILMRRFLSLIFKSRLGDHWNHAVIFCAVVDSVSFMFFFPLCLFFSPRIKVSWVDDTRFKVTYIFFYFIMQFVFIVFREGNFISLMTHRVRVRTLRILMACLSFIIWSSTKTQLESKT